MPMMKSQILRYVNSSKAQKSECHENKTITFFVWINSFIIYNRGGSTTDTTSKMECFVIIVNGFQPLTTITKCSILDVAVALDPSLHSVCLYNLLSVILLMSCGSDVYLRFVGLKQSEANMKNLQFPATNWHKLKGNWNFTVLLSKKNFKETLMW